MPPRQSTIFFKVKQKADAELLATALTSLGFENMDMTRVGWFVFSTYRLKAVLTSSPNEVAADAFVEKLVRLAANHRAIYDGWGMSLG
jgi:hypothetical protein